MIKKGGNRLKKNNGISKLTILSIADLNKNTNNQRNQNMNNINKKNINNSQLNMIDIKSIIKEVKTKELKVAYTEPDLKEQQEV